MFIPRLLIWVVVVAVVMLATVVCCEIRCGERFVGLLSRVEFLHLLLLMAVILEVGDNEGRL